MTAKKKSLDPKTPLGQSETWFEYVLENQQEMCDVESAWDEIP